MDHLNENEFMMYRRENIGRRINGYIPVKSVNYQRHYNRIMREYKYGKPLILDRQLYYNYYDNWESKLNMFLIKNTIYICPICFNPGINCNKKTLLCDHSLCANCLRNMISHGMVYCPFCRNNMATNSPQPLYDPTIDPIYIEEDNLASNSFKNKAICILAIVAITFFILMIILLSSITIKNIL